MITSDTENFWTFEWVGIDQNVIRSTDKFDSEYEAINAAQKFVTIRGTDTIVQIVKCYLSSIYLGKAELYPVALDADLLEKSRVIRLLKSGTPQNQTPPQQR